MACVCSISVSTTGISKHPRHAEIQDGLVALMFKQLITESVAILQRR